MNVVVVDMIRFFVFNYSEICLHEDKSIFDSICLPYFSLKNAFKTACCAWYKSTRSKSTSNYHSLRLERFNSLLLNFVPNQN